ncbi:Uncharacterised protein [BD1-7 clade bacterium]|uniref:Uncharacterized protein n=1 Tax=BD1-7 clade bacterium TaxID=2029982 RepID=A0A5S9PK33_9GAMM|nr:Uncharacterised protein [BD1-7 clade bacterium]CAA0104201.1 Uncharacterised protein [BD1-7 clade bacterium]
MGKITDTIKQIITDTPSDMLKTLVASAISILGLLIWAEVSQWIPAEFTERRFILISSALIIAGFYLLFLSISLRSIGRRAAALAGLVAVVATAWQTLYIPVFERYADQQSPFIVVFYPSELDSAKQKQIDHALRTATKSVRGHEGFIDIIKTPVTYTGKLDTSIAARLLNHHPHAIGYLEVIATDDDLTINPYLPLTLPYKSLGATGVNITNGSSKPHMASEHQNIQDDDKRIALSLVFDRMQLVAGLGINKPAYHHGIADFSLLLSVESTSGAEELAKQLIAPLSDSFASDTNNLAMDIDITALHLAGLHDYFLGDWQAICRATNGIEDRHSDQGLLRYNQLFSSESWVACVDDKYDQLTLDINRTPQNQLQQLLISHMLERDIRRYRRLVTSPKTLTLTDQFRSQCAATQNTDRIDCLFDFINANSNALSTEYELHDALLNELREAHNTHIQPLKWLDNENKIYQSAIIAARQFEHLGQPQLACDSQWSWILMASLIANVTYLNNVDDLFTLLNDRVTLIHSNTQCDDITFFDINLSKLMQSPAALNNLKAIAQALQTGTDENSTMTVGDAKQQVLQAITAIEPYSGREFRDKFAYLLHQGSNVTANCDSFGNGLIEKLTGNTAGFYQQMICTLYENSSDQITEASSLHSLDQWMDDQYETGVVNKLFSLIPLLQHQFKDRLLVQLMHMANQAPTVTPHPKAHQGLQQLHYTQVARMHLHKPADATAMIAADALTETSNPQPAKTTTAPPVSNNPSALHYRFARHLFDNDIASARKVADQLRRYPNTEYYQHTLDFVQSPSTCDEHPDFHQQVAKHFLLHGENVIRAKHLKNQKVSGDGKATTTYDSSANAYFDDYPHYLQLMDTFVAESARGHLKDADAFIDQARRCGTLL